MSNEASSSRPTIASSSLEASSSTATPTSAKEERAFERWRKSAAWITGVGLTPEDQAQRQAQKELQRDEALWIRCEKWKDDLLKTSTLSLPYDPLTWSPHSTDRLPTS